MAYGNQQPPPPGQQGQQQPPPPGQQPPQQPPQGQAPPPGYSGQQGRYPPGEKSRVTYGILAILVGWLGIHQFYVGNTGYGVIYLILGICGFGIGGLLGLISGILALTKSDEEFYQKYIVEQSFI